MKFWLPLLILASCFGSFFLNQVSQAQITLSGKVVDAQTNQPLSGVHVYIESGEEEAFSDKAGKFRIQSWKKLPLTLHAEHKDFQKQSLQVTAAGETIELKLKKK